MTFEDYINQKHIRINCVDDYHKCRLTMNEIGIDTLYNHLVIKEYVENGKLVPHKGPMNIFAKYGNDLIPNLVPQNSLLNHQNEFVIVHNRQSEYDAWNDSKSSGGAMAGPDDGGPGHVFMTTKNMDWHLFNVLTLGMKQTDLEFLERMKEAATMYAKSRGWKRTGMYFHCFPLNSVHSLHLHIVNLDRVGVHHHRQYMKNLPLDAVITELKNSII
jgi:hypothetical protein